MPESEPDDRTGVSVTAPDGRLKLILLSGHRQFSLNSRDTAALKTGTAEDRPLIAREEGYHCGSATGGAHDLVHLAAWLAEFFAPAINATRRAALWLMDKPLFGVKRLFALREDKLTATISALKRLVIQHACTPNLQSAKSLLLPPTEWAINITHTPTFRSASPSTDEALAATTRRQRHKR